MKKFIVLLFLSLQFFAISEASAACNLSQFSFGSSLKDVEVKLKYLEADNLHANSSFFATGDKVSLGLSAEQVCKRDKEFIGAHIIMIFLYDKLVELNLYKFIESGDNPGLIYWAESVYGEKNPKPPSFYEPEPSAFWFWRGLDSTASYSLESIAYGIDELVTIQTNKYQDLYSKYSAELESGN